MKSWLYVTLFSFLIVILWDKVPFIKGAVHLVLDPTLGFLLNLNLYFGMCVIVFLFTSVSVLVQKYGTDQEELKRIKEEQKILRKEMDKYKANPEKLMALQKKQLEFIPKTMDITMKPLIYTAVPFILFFRWFNDYFSGIEFKFFGVLSWFWFYIILSIVISMVLRKILKLA